MLLRRNDTKRAKTLNNTPYDNAFRSTIIRQNSIRPRCQALSANHRNGQRPNAMRSKSPEGGKGKSGRIRIQLSVAIETTAPMQAPIQNALSGAATLLMPGAFMETILVALELRARDVGILEVRSPGSIAHPNPQSLQSPQMPSSERLPRYWNQCLINRRLVPSSK